MTEEGESTPPLPASHGHAARLARMGYSALGLGAAVYWFYAPWESPLLKLLAIGICVMGIWPVLRWLERNDRAYPLLEVLQLTMVPFYAVPLLTEHDAVIAYPEAILIQASWQVLGFQIACSLGGMMADRSTGGTPGRVWWNEELIPEQNLRFTSYTLMLTTAWLVLSSFSRLIPAELMGTLRAIFFGIGIISGFIQARLWGSGLLNQSQKTLLVVNITLQILLSNLSLMLITSLITLLLVLVGYFSTARRIPWLTCLVALPLFALLHSGKHKMREIYWGDQGHEVGISDVPSFYQQWFSFGLAGGIKIAGKEEDSGHSSLLDRASLFQLVCFTIDTVPDRTPYLNGTTYAYVLPQIIPRFMWPGKPSPNDSVKMLSVKMGMLSEEQAETTSIGYGLIAEAYANFGLIGNVVLALLLGLTARTISRRTADCSTFSLGGVFRILCLAWCLNAETTLAVWLSSLYQASIAVGLPLLLYRTFLGGK
jgi:hypothetical protein